MKKVITISVIALFVGMSFTSISGIQINNQIVKTSEKGSILYVGGDGPGNYTSIQDAVDDASNGDTVFVYNGIYYENVWIDEKSINLIGEDKNTTMLEGPETGDVIAVLADWVNISGFTIHGNTQKYSAGIWLYNLCNSTITNNNILNNYYGIFLHEKSKHNIIKCNNITSNINGGIMLFYYCQNNLITDNIIIYNYEGIIVEYHSDYNTIKENIISLNDYDGIHTLRYSNNTVIINNTISLNKENGIGLAGSYFNFISDNIIKNNYHGIELWYSSKNNIIIKNNFLNNSIGFTNYFVSNSGNNIYHNNFIDNLQNAYDEGNNTWDNGFSSGGNHWYDYEERYPDAKPKLFKPWMWDTPYEIERGNNKDNYPLIKRWPNSVSIDIQRNKITNNVLLLRILERFPLLQQLYGVWRDFIV
jgi:parallel beta-helix repeat protein